MSTTLFIENQERPDVSQVSREASLEELSSPAFGTFVGKEAGKDGGKDGGSDGKEHDRVPTSEPNREQKFYNNAA